MWIHVFRALIERHYGNIFKLIFFVVVRHGLIYSNELTLMFKP